MDRLRRTALAGAILVGGCTAHPVGPARTADAYEGKAVTTAESALSNVETVRLAARSASDDHAFGPYLSVVVSEQEDGLAGLQGTFGSVQPPGATSDELRDELDQLMADALGHITEVRIAVRRGELRTLEGSAEPLDDDAAAIRSFIEDHSG
jgi:hypothetical protein